MNSERTSSGIVVRQFVSTRDGRQIRVNSEPVVRAARLLVSVLREYLIFHDPIRILFSPPKQIGRHVWLSSNDEVCRKKATVRGSRVRGATAC